MATHTDILIPVYNGEDAELYFNVLEATFQAYGLEDQHKKFILAFSALPQDLRTAAKPALDKEPQLRYTELKALVIKKKTIPETERMQLLLSTTTIGDRKPSEFLQHLRTLIREKN